MVTITVDNLGAAGAEVPLTVKFQGGEISKRLVVRGKSNGVIRVEVPQQPEEIVVNDGSVPESDVTNNSFQDSGRATYRNNLKSNNDCEFSGSSYSENRMFGA